MVFFPSCFVKVRVSFRVSAKRIADGVFGRSRDSFLGWNQSKGCSTCRALLVRVKPLAREERPTKMQRRGRTFFAFFLGSSRSQGVKVTCCAVNASGTSRSFCFAFQQPRAAASESLACRYEMRASFFSLSASEIFGFRPRDICKILLCPREGTARK